MTPSGTDYVTLMPFPVGMNCVQAPENIIHILLSCQSTERACEGLNPELNCAHFSLTTPEIRAADTKVVLKACFDSNRLERVAFFSSPAQIVCVCVEGIKSGKLFGPHFSRLSATSLSLDMCEC